MKLVSNMDDFIKAGNLKDIKHFICKKFPRIIRHDLSLEDIVQSVIVHMLHSKTLDKFDPDRGMTFSSYIFMVLKSFLICKYYNLSGPRRDWYEKTVSLTGHNLGQIDRPSPEGCNDLRIDLNIMLGYLKDLPENQLGSCHAQVFQALAEGKDYKDLGAMFSISLQGAQEKRRTTRALIIKHLEQNGYFVQ